MNKGIFLQDFRDAVTRLLDAGQEVVNLSNQYAGNGWTGADFDLTGDISAADLDAAITGCLALSAEFAVVAVPLMKMRK